MRTSHLLSCHIHWSTRSQILSETANVLITARRRPWRERPSPAPAGSSHAAAKDEKRPPARTFCWAVTHCGKSCLVSSWKWRSRYCPQKPCRWEVVWLALYTALRYGSLLSASSLTVSQGQTAKLSFSWVHRHTHHQSVLVRYLLGFHLILLLPVFIPAPWSFFSYQRHPLYMTTLSCLPKCLIPFTCSLAARIFLIPHVFVKIFLSDNSFPIKRLGNGFTIWL